jgi:multiple sugar transport system substrate-binding protein
MKTYPKLLVSLLIVISIFVAGCANQSSVSDESNGSNESSDEGSRKVTLDLALWDEGMSDVLDKTIADFEANNPNVKVNITFTPWSDYWTRTRTSLAGGSGPDVFWINGSNFYQYAASGLIKNMQPMIDKENFDTSVYTPALLELYSFEGDLYGLPNFLDSIALFYNKRMFDDAGLEYPDETWTWDTIEEVGAQLTNKDKGIYGYIAQVKPQEGYYNLIFQAGGYVLSEDKKTSGFDSPEVLSAFKWMEKLMEEGISPKIQQQMETEPKQIFNSGRAAMIPLISVNVPESYKMLGDDLGVAPLPAGKQKATVVHGLSWVINQNTEEEELAWELAKALTGKKANEYIAESGFSIPAYLGTEDKWLESIPSVELQVFIDSLEFGVPSPVSKNSAQWNDVLAKELQEAFLGRKSIEEALKTITEDMNEILANE